MKKIGLIGYLGYTIKEPIIGGQMSKTRGIYQELIKKYGKENIIALDTSNWRKEKVSIFFKMIDIAYNCNPIIIMPNKNGIKVILLLYALLKPLFHYVIAYPVVGGWLTGLLRNYKYLSKSIKKVDCILPETQALANELKEFVNCEIKVMPVFSTRSPVSQNLIKKSYSKIKKFCMFSRIIPEKGIDEAINTVVDLNSTEKICHLDIWGPIDEKYKEHYKEIFEINRSDITYKGILAENDGLEILAEYYMLLFPTYYSGEGFPITICESFMAALPVIASNWRFNGELVEDRKTGYLIPTHDKVQLKAKILEAINNESIIITMKRMALKKSYDFIPEQAMKNLLDWIDGHRQEN